MGQAKRAAWASEAGWSEEEVRLRVKKLRSLARQYRESRIPRDMEYADFLDQSARVAEALQDLHLLQRGQ